MPGTYYINATAKTAEYLLHKVIEVRSEDTIPTHLANIFLSKNDNKLSGYYKNNHFKLWFSSFIWTRAFYPVLYGEIIDKGDKTIFKISGKLNPVAFVFTALISILLLIYFVFPYISGSLGFNDILRRVLVSAVVLLFSNFPAILCYYVIKDAMIKELKEKIGLKTL